MALKGWKKDNINLILVGETGTGKTTFMSFIDNMCRGRKLEEFENTWDVRIETGGDGYETQTNEATLYTIKCTEGQTPRDPSLSAKTINILDTPGLGDTRGIQHDKAHKEQIAAQIKNNLHTVDAIVILVNGLQKRCWVTTAYALENIAAIFPRSLIKNIGFVLTNCTNSTMNFDITRLQEYNESPHWPIQNPLALWNIYQSAKNAAATAEATNSKVPYNDDDLEDMEDNTKKAYKNGVRFLDEFMAWLDTCPTQATTEIEELNKKLNTLDTEVSNIISRLNAMQDVEAEIRRMQDRITQEEMTMNMNKFWEETQYFDVWVRVDTQQYHTVCIGTESCHSNCHVSCSCSPNFPIDPRVLGDQCVSFRGQPGDGNSRICKECGHIALDHRHYRSLWEQRKEARIKMNPEAKRAFEDATMRKEREEALKASLDMQLDSLKEEIQKKQNEIAVLCNQYKSMSISRGFAWYIYSMKRMLLQRFDAQSKEGAPQKELDELNELIQQAEQKYEIIEKEEKSRQHLEVNE